MKPPYPRLQMARFSTRSDTNQVMAEQQKNKHKDPFYSKVFEEHMRFDVPTYRLVPFQLGPLGRRELLQNSFYLQFYRKLEKYNQWLIKNGEKNLIQYRLHQFIFSTLQICLTKTKSQSEILLRQTSSWIDEYSRTRPKDPIAQRKNEWIKGQDKIVRQSFRSLLPLEVDNYVRRVFSIEKEGTSDKVVQKITQTPWEINLAKKGKRDKPQYDDPISLKIYRLQSLKMRKRVEQRQQRKILSDFKRNQMRIKAQSSSNFYKLSNKSTDTKNKKLQLSQMQIKNKQNMSVIVNQTASTFFQIKKQSLNKMIHKNKQKFGLPRFTSYGEGHFKGKSPEKNEFNEDKDQVECIEGINLLRNPFEITRKKTKSQKKKL